MDAEEALEDEEKEKTRRQKQPSSSSSSSSSSKKWRSGSGRAMRANHIVYYIRGLQSHAAADATVSEKEACGLLVEKDTGAYARLTPGLRAGTHKNHYI